MPKASRRDRAPHGSTEARRGPETLEIAAAPGGSRLRLRVKPGARRRGIEGEHGGALRVAVTAPPERGRANEEVVEVVAAALGVPRTALRIARGQGSRDKSLVIDGVSPDELRRRLAAHVGALP